MLSSAPAPGRIGKHNHLRDVLFRFGHDGTMSPAKEYRLDSVRTAPGDVYFPMWSHCRGKAFDVMITSSSMQALLLWTRL